MWLKLLLGAVGIGLALAIAAFAIGKLVSASYDRGVLAERVRWQAVARAQADKLHALERQWLERRAEAQSVHHERMVEIQTVGERSREAVAQYAQTAAGSVHCVDAVGVQLIRANRSALYPEPASSARRGAQPVRTASAAGR